MAKIIIVLVTVMALQSCIVAAPNAEKSPGVTAEENPKNEQADPKLNSEPYKGSEPAKVISEKTPQGQRQKRFYDYLDFDFSPFGPYNHNSIKRDDSQNTGVFNSPDNMLQILRRVQSILSYTRQQVLPPPVSHYPVHFIPFYYFPRGVCDCTPTAPGNGEETSNGARPTQPTTISPIDSTQGTSPANEPSPSPTDDTNKTTLDFFSRLPNIDDEDGTRPVSFVPVIPKTPLSRPPPPVEHGSSQASSGNGVKEVTTTTERPIIMGLPAQPHLPTNSIPTLCDGAVLTCCHRSEVTYDCFKSQGCPNPAFPDDPCEENIILKVINKFQYYYANRRG